MPETRQSGDMLCCCLLTADVHSLRAAVLLRAIQGFCFICRGFWNEPANVLCVIVNTATWDDAVLDVHIGGLRIR